MDVYPNPSYGDITLDVDEPGKEVIIYNMNGEVVFTKTVVDEYNGQIKDLSSLDSGMYIVRYGNGENECTQKIVLKTREGNFKNNSQVVSAYY